MLGDNLNPVTGGVSRYRGQRLSVGKLQVLNIAKERWRLSAGKTRYTIR